MSLKKTKKTKRKNNLLAVRIHPWQLFKFKKWAEASQKRPSQVIQEALQIYFSTLNLPQELTTSWIDEYHKQQEQETE